MSSSAQKIIVATKQKINSFQRKLAWFEFRNNNLYFEIAGILEGSHNSYHKDGNIFRTRPATNNKPKPIKAHLPLEQFKGWYPLGPGMILKSSLNSSPKLKNRDSKHLVYEIDINQFPSEALNLVVDILEPNRDDLLACDTMSPPHNAHIIKITTSKPWLIITILGHDHNLLISPYDNGQSQGVTCRHINDRYSANRPGGGCVSYEAYKID